MKDNKEIRKEVSEFYANKVTSGGGCCCGSRPSPIKGITAKTAGYEESEILLLPKDAVENSFGCGNPLAFSDVKEGQTVLDLGCGAGIDLLIAAEKVGKRGRVIGVDMTDEMIERARKNIEASGKNNIEVRKGIIEELAIESDSADWVISNCVINLSPEKERVFAEIFRILKPGGRISVSDIVVKDMPEWTRNNAALYGACVSGAVSEEEYIAGLKAAGLVEVEVVERLVYDASQINAIIESEILKEAVLNCCGKNGGINSLKEAAQKFEGNIWSAKFRGVKPKY